MFSNIYHARIISPSFNLPIFTIFTLQSLKKLIICFEFFSNSNTSNGICSIHQLAHPSTNHEKGHHMHSNQKSWCLYLQDEQKSISQLRFLKQIKIYIQLYIYSTFLLIHWALLYYLYIHILCYPLWGTCIGHEYLYRMNY